jgi:hypothetical protein
MRDGPFLFVDAATVLCLRSVLQPRCCAGRRCLAHSAMSSMLSGRRVYLIMEWSQLETLPNVGLQLLDVVTATDARAGISSELYRVRGIEEVCDSTKEALVFEERVDLGGR